MSYRVIQWGTGNVGTHALRSIVDRPDFELAGVRVYNPAKVGKDAGDLIGAALTGVLATDSTEEILDVHADCACYTPLGSTLESAERSLDDICRLLASGKNVVSSAVEYHAYLRPGVALPQAGIDAYDRITSACEKGNTSFFHAGINPGYSMEVWPLLLTQTCRRIDTLTVTEVIDMRKYPSVHMLEYIGFGAPSDDSPMDKRMRANLKVSPFYLGMVALCEQLGLELEDVHYQREIAVTETPLEIAAGRIDAGTAAAIRFRFDGIINGRPTIIYEWVWRIADDIAPEWPTGASRWILHIDGDPTVDSEFSLATTLDAGRATSLSVATVLLNAIPAIVAAAPGLYNNMTIGLHGGGYVLP